MLNAGVLPPCICQQVLSIVKALIRTHFKLAILFSSIEFVNWSDLFEFNELGM